MRWEALQLSVCVLNYWRKKDPWRHFPTLLQLGNMAVQWKWQTAAVPLCVWPNFIIIFPSTRSVPKRHSGITTFESMVIERQPHLRWNSKICSSKGSFLVFFRRTSWMQVMNVTCFWGNLTCIEFFGSIGVLKWAEWLASLSRYWHRKQIAALWERKAHFHFRRVHICLTATVYLA